MPLYAFLSTSQRLLIKCLESVDVPLNVSIWRGHCTMKCMWIKETASSVTDFVKQGYVLASTLFSLYLTAMLAVAFDGVGDGIFIQTRTDADLFFIYEHENGWQ